MNLEKRLNLIQIYLSILLGLHVGEMIAKAMS